MTRHITYPEFVQSLNDQDIYLRSGLQADFPSVAYEYYQPDGWFGAMAVANYQLRTDPASQLTSDIIPDEILGKTSTVVQRTLVNILNASLMPSDNQPPGINFVSNFCRMLGSCSEAESNFAETFAAMQSSPNAPAHTRLGLSVGWTILQHEAEIVGVQKTLGEPSTLSLAPITINGIPHPAGTILRTDLRGRLPAETTAKYTTGTANITAIAAMRLSLFALPDDERSAIPTDERFLPKHCGYTIEQIRDIAREALQHCQPL